MACPDEISTIRWKSVTLYAAIFLAGCDLFLPRTPEDPEGGGGTWLQPDTPERVITNLQTAVAELNQQNYNRSLSENFTFDPTTLARARDPALWNNWRKAEEQTYFLRLQAAATPFSDHSLQFLDETRTILADDRFVLDATYLLTVLHTRVDEGLPTEVQGRIIWEIALEEDGLWRLLKWTDQEVGNNPSWSDLKAAFVK